MTIPERPNNESLLIWYRNGCTSGLSSLEKAAEQLNSLSKEKQDELQKEFRLLQKRISEDRSSSSGTFSG